MIESICLKCPLGHPVVIALFDTAKLEFAFAVQTVPAILVQQNIKNTCPKCGATAVQTGIDDLNHLVTPATSFFDIPVDVPADVDLTDITILVMAYKDGTPWICSLKLPHKGDMPQNPATN